MTNLDLNKFPEIENFHGLLKYNPLEEFPELAGLDDITQRVYGCAHFIVYSPASDFPYLSENANTRAYLNEFASLNEILKSHNRAEFRRLAIEQTDYPLFHFFKLLRNANFHIRTLLGGAISYQGSILNSQNGVVVEKDLTFTSFVIENCNLTLLENVRDIKHYEKSQIEKTIQWVNNKQNISGISYVLEANLRQYCKLIVASL
jgi:hypothetical protein